MGGIHVNVELFVSEIKTAIQKELEGSEWKLQVMKAVRGFVGLGADQRDFQPHSRGDVLAFHGVADHPKHGAKQFQFVAYPEIMTPQSIAQTAEDMRKGLEWSAVGEQK